MQIELTYRDLEEISQYEKVSLSQYIGSVISLAKQCAISFKDMGKAMKALCKPIRKAKRAMRRAGINMDIRLPLIFILIGMGNIIRFMETKMNEGKRFEEDFKKSVPDGVWYYRFKDGTASWGGGENVRFQSRNICDCMLFNGFNLYLIELKSHNATSFPLSAIREKQIEDMMEASRYFSVVPVVIINMRKYERTFMIHIFDICKFIENSERKSMPIDWMELHGEEIIGEKKRTRWKYDLSEYFS